MKTTGLFVFAALAILLSAGSAKAWNCTTPGQIRVQVPAGTAGSGSGDGSGQVDTVEGITFECEALPTATPTGGNSNATSNSSSNSQSASSATGGSSRSQSSATGGNAAGGNANAAVSNSGNATVSNNVVASGGAGGTATARGGNQKQTQSQSLTNSGNSSATASGNGNNSDNSTYIVPRQVASAIAPSVAPTTPCFKGFSGGGQSATFGFSFGGGKIDENCAELEASRLAPSLVARCKVYLTNKYVKQAGVTMEDCLGPIGPTQVDVAVPTQVNPVVAQAPIIITNPAPIVDVTIVPPPVVAPAPNIVKASRAQRKPVHHVMKPCDCKVVTNDNIK